MLSTEAVFSDEQSQGISEPQDKDCRSTISHFLCGNFGTFRRQAAEDLRVYVRGQKMIDSLVCREESKHLVP